MHQSDEIEIDLKKLFTALVDRIGVIFACGCLLASLFFGYAHLFITPTYSSTAMLYVNSSNLSLAGSKVSISTQELSAAKSLIDTYIVILNTRTTLEEVLEKADIDYYSYQQLSRMLTAKSVNGTEVFSVTVTSTDPAEAELLANTIAQLMPNRIASIVDGSSARIVDTAVESSVPVAPIYLNYLLNGFVLGTIVSAVIVVLLALFDDKVSDSEAVSKKFGKPILAVIPDLTAHGTSSSYAGRENMGRRRNERGSAALDEHSIGDTLSFAAKEAYKRLRTNIDFSLPKDSKNCRIIGITSSLSGEGKSTTAINLAYTMAQAEKHVLLIEADMRLPTVYRRLGLKSAPGLSNLLIGQCSATDILQKTSLSSNIRVISAGDLPPNPTELLDSVRMRNTLEVLSGFFSVIIVDLPPVISVSDALSVSKYLDGMLLVVRQDYCDVASLRATINQLDFSKAKTAGFVVTDAKIQKKPYKRYGKKYGYYDYAKRTKDNNV